MIINLPWIEPMDTKNMPDNFKELVEESFRRFTKGTNKDYRQTDKLLYLDNLRREYTYPYEKHDEDVECGEFPDEEDFYSLELMKQCYATGDITLYKHIKNLVNSDSEEHQIHNIIFEIIKTVVNYEDKEVNNE